MIRFTQKCGLAFASLAAPGIALATGTDAGMAGSGSALSLRAASVHAGGGFVSGGPWSATLAVGQPEFIDATVSSGDRLQLTGGVLRRAPPRPEPVFGDGFEDQSTPEETRNEIP